MSIGVLSWLYRERAMRAWALKDPPGTYPPGDARVRVYHHGALLLTDVALTRLTGTEAFAFTLSRSTQGFAVGTVAQMDGPEPELLTRIHYNPSGFFRVDTGARVERWPGLWLAGDGAAWLTRAAP